MGFFSRLRERREVKRQLERAERDLQMQSIKERLEAKMERQRLAIEEENKRRFNASQRIFKHGFIPVLCSNRHQPEAGERRHESHLRTISIFSGGAL